MRLEDLQGRATISVPELAEVLGCGKGQAYDAVRDGRVPSLRVGRSIRIPVPRLLELLGSSPATTPQPVTRETEASRVIVSLEGDQVVVHLAALREALRVVKSASVPPGT